MRLKSLQLHLGIAACAVSIFLVLFAIPQWVSSPSNVPLIILSPLFWPYTISGMSALIGILMLIQYKRMPNEDSSTNNEQFDEEAIVDRSAAFMRLIGMGIIMVITMMLLPTFGMVWTTMLVFLATAFLVKTRHPITAFICAIIIPLLLYAFFAHVAGVGIPQGDFVRLP
jgi:hypothetical protein